jgi:regulator of protease activity HflC (stomatin/prohibitin superfamily)
MKDDEVEDDEAVSRRQAAQETRNRQYQKGNPGGFVSTIVFFISIAFIVCFALGLYSGLNLAYIILGIFLFFAAICVNNIKIVQKPEIWVIERFGEYNRKLGPGIHWIIPWIETVRARPRINERYIEILDSQRAIIFRDGPAHLKNPRAYVELDETHVEDAIYKVDNWGTWVNKVLGPIVRGYLNTLTIDEALDEGAARGDILEKMAERPDITRKQIKQLSSSIRKFSKKINDLDKKKSDIDLRLHKAARDTLEDKKREKEICLANQEVLKTELETFRNNAVERGFKKIHRVGIGEFIISDELKNAREDIQKAKKEAVSAVDKAITEAIMRTEPIVRARERFKDIGFSEEEAREKAFMIDIVETLAEKRSLFLTGAGKGDLNTLAAQVAAIFGEVSQRRKEPKVETKKPKEETKK